MYSNSFEKKEGSEIGQKVEGEEGLLGIGRIECFQEKGKEL